jgi:uncharacterized membrane protein YoaT (DUF817 family)
MTSESAEYGVDILSSRQDPNALKVNDLQAFFIFVDFPRHEFLYDFRWLKSFFSKLYFRNTY